MLEQSNANRKKRRKRRSGTSERKETKPSKKRTLPGLHDSLGNTELNSAASSGSRDPFRSAVRDVLKGSLSEDSLSAKLPQTVQSVGRTPRTVNFGGVQHYGGEHQDQITHLMGTDEFDDVEGALDVNEADKVKVICPYEDEVMDRRKRLQTGSKGGDASTLKASSDMEPQERLDRESTRVGADIFDEAKRESSEEQREEAEEVRAEEKEEDEVEEEEVALLADLDAFDEQEATMVDEEDVEQDGAKSDDWMDRVMDNMEPKAAERLRGLTSALGADLFDRGATDKRAERRRAMEPAPRRKRDDWSVAAA